MLVGCATHFLSASGTLPDVSESPSIETDESLPRGVLLIEEYHALGVAISSALRKFAPLHVVKVARDFVEAEKFAATLRPELFVLDIDPPPLGEIEFLRAISARYPGARLLVIAPGISSQLRAEHEAGGAIHVFEKPFDLAEFGVAVQALVTPRHGSLGGRRTLRRLNILDLAEVKCLAHSSSVLRLDSAAGSGAIHFQKGQIVHAATEMRHGEEALREMTGWPLDRMSETESLPVFPRTIDADWPGLLLPLLRELEALEPEEQPCAADQSAPERAGTGKKILVIDDTELLLIFVAEVLSQADPGFRITTAQSGGEGLRLATNERPDLILLDYSLTDTTGNKICQALLENEATRRIPVLMMSGHPTELARTAEDYANVVAALPKPFLSGALVKAVENALAAGPLPAPAPAPAPKPAPMPPPPLAPETAAPLPNGHGPAGDGATAKGELPVPEPTEIAPPQPPPAETPPALPKEPASSPAIEVPTAPPAPAPAAATGSGTTGLFVRGATIFVTISFDVVALQLTPTLRTASARLEPISRFAAVEMADGTRFEAGFQLGPAEVAGDGTINSLKLVPTRQPIPLPAAANSFAIGRIQIEPAQKNLELKAAPERSMRVQLTAPFRLNGIELSTLFEVSALLLQGHGREVWLRNSPDDSGTTFTIDQVELDPAGELRAVLVRPTPNE